MPAYYNEIDPYAAQWLRNLISAGHIAPGDVDERSIVDVRAADLAGYDQCHFFAGIGGWSVALRLAGWPDDRSVWTGSCPCQPFSAAGKGEAFADERHLWPRWFPLIAERRPAIVFGEQVEAAIGWGWLDAVFADLEGEGYACGAAVLPACGVGAPHIRQRTWFVANADGRDASTEGLQRGGEQRQQPQDGRAVRLALAAGERLPRPAARRGDAGLGVAARNGGMVDAAGEQVGLPGRARQSGDASGALVHSERAAAERQRRVCLPVESEQEAGRPGYANPWSQFELVECADGKARPTQPGLFPLAHGIRGRVGRLRAYGNAISPQIAAEFIRASAGQ